jgi:hypothetical protein
MGPEWSPVLGLTRGTDGAWSARFWRRLAPREFERRWVDSVRVVGRHLRVTYHPDLTAPPISAAQMATVSVWGEQAQADLARSRVGIVGLGSVCSIVAEALARVGFGHVTLIDFDVLEDLDRTAGTAGADIGLSKVEVAARNVRQAATGPDLEPDVVEASLLDAEGLAAALDCDVLISCVDRPRPRHLLNAYAHLIPVIDGGIAAGVKPDGTPLHVDWRIHTVGPDNACLVCMDALRRSDVALDIAGRLDDADYINKLPASERARFSRRNVYPFSLSVAAHEVLQLVGLLTGFERVSGTGPQHYRGYPGVMEVSAPECASDCEYMALTASAADMSGNLRSSA